MGIGTILLIVSVVILVNLAISFFIIRRLNRRALSLTNNRVTNLITENETLREHLSRTEKQLAHCEKLARLVKQSPNGIMIMDAEGNVLDVNRGFEDLYEYKYEEFIGACGSNYRKTSFDPVKVEERLDVISRTKKPVRYEALNITKSGAELWTQTALSPILNDENEIIGLATIDTDIHKRVVESDNLVQKMEEMNQKIDHMSRQFNQLVTETQSLFESINQSKQLIEQTGQIILFIKGISDKTRILGLNASIEANVAGIQGKGFRIIANEIVDISNQTIQSVRKISDLLNSVGQKQSELITRKSNSEDTIHKHQQLIKQLKNEIKEVEAAIADFKSLT